MKHRPSAAPLPQRARLLHLVRRPINLLGAGALPVLAASALALAAPGCGEARPSKVLDEARFDAMAASAMPASSFERTEAGMFEGGDITVLRRIFKRRIPEARVALDGSAWERELLALDAFGDVGRSGKPGRNWHYDCGNDRRCLSLDCVELGDGQVLVVAREVLR
jgi:hypothetical protein